jgi:hypothetical protein
VRQQFIAHIKKPAKPAKHKVWARTAIKSYGFSNGHNGRGIALDDYFRGFWRVFPSGVVSEDEIVAWMRTRSGNTNPYYPAGPLEQWIIHRLLEKFVENGKQMYRILFNPDTMQFPKTNFRKLGKFGAHAGS